MPLQEWPEIDQRAWHVGRADGDLFDGSEASFRWKPQTFKVVATHYGRWLTYLKGSGLLDPTMGPAARINGQSLKGYVERLDEQCARTTSAGRINGLVRAVLVMEPNADVRRLKLLAAKSRRDYLPAKRPPEKLPPISQLYALGLRLMEETSEIEERQPMRVALRFRDGLMIAMLAARPLRMRDFSIIRIGLNLERQGDRFWLGFATSKTKHARPYHVPLPDELNPLVELYLAVHRVTLLKGMDESSLWISQYGTRARMHTIRHAIIRSTRKYLKVALTPHDFRHCAVTSASIQDPEHVQICAALLGHRSIDTATQHYNHATTLDASRRYHALIEKLRDEL